MSEHARPISTNYSTLIDMWVGTNDLIFVLRSLRDVAMVTNKIGVLFANVEFDCFQSLHWRFETECSIAICIKALTQAMMHLHNVTSSSAMAEGPRDALVSRNSATIKNTI